MRTSALKSTVLSLMSLAAATPLKCTPAASCGGLVTATKTHTAIAKTTITFSDITKTYFVQATGTSTLSPSCPTSTQPSKRSASVSTSTSSASTPACNCPSAKTTLIHTTITSTHTKTSTIKTTGTVTKYSATSTPSSFYLQSSIDGTFAYPDLSPNYDYGYFTLHFGSCDPTSPENFLFNFNSTTQELTHSSTGWIADNAAQPGATGEEVSFSSPADLDNDYGYPAPLMCAVGQQGPGLLSCGLFDSNEPFELCDGTLLWGGQSYLCDALTVSVVKPSWV